MEYTSWKEKKGGGGRILAPGQIKHLLLNRNRLVRGCVCVRVCGKSGEGKGGKLGIGNSCVATLTVLTSGVNV